MANALALASQRSCLLIAWLCSGPLLFSAISRATAHHIFVERYLLYAVPASALIVAWLLSANLNPRVRLFSMCAFLAISFALSDTKLRIHGLIEWRTPIAWLNQNSTPSDYVFVRSGFTESRFPGWDAESQSRFMSPIAIYPVQAHVIPLPYAVTPDCIATIEQAFTGELAHADRFFLLSSDYRADILDWLPRRAAQLGFSASVHREDWTVVVVFTRNGALGTVQK